MITIRRRTRETLRHERAVVLQQKGANADANPLPFYRANKRRAAELRKWAAEHGHEPKPLTGR